MQKISVENLQPGMTPAYNVLSSDGGVLVHSGMSLNEKAIKRLQSLPLRSIYINNFAFEDLDMPELFQENLRVEAIKTVQTVFSQFIQTQELNVGPLITLANSIVDHVVLGSDSMIHGVDTRTYQDYIYGNAVNVCVLSVLMGLLLDYNTEKMRDLALGALLHDIGSLLTPPEVLFKPGKLTAEEMDIVRRHAEVGFDILRKSREISSPAAHVAYQHHENFDGSGYPRGLKKDEIHEFARIVAITNMYDALVSDRTFRKGFLPHEAYELLMTLTHKYLDPKLLDIFLANVAIYPTGSIVQLNTNELAIVAKVYPRLQTRPVVRILTTPDGEYMGSSVEIDLTQKLTTFVVKQLTEQEIIALDQQIRRSQNHR